MAPKSFKFHINIRKRQNLLRNSQSVRMHYQREFLLFRKYVGISPPPNIMETITDLCDVNANMRSSEQTVKPSLQSMMEKVSVIVDYHTELWSTNRSFKELIILRKIHFGIHLTKYRMAYIQGSCLFGRVFYGQQSNLCSKLNVTKDLIVVRCTKELYSPALHLENQLGTRVFCIASVVLPSSGKAPRSKQTPNASLSSLATY